jgi:hypothetical protein
MLSMDACCLSFNRKKHAFVDRRLVGAGAVSFFLTAKVSIWRNPSLAILRQTNRRAMAFAKIDRHQSPYLQRGNGMLPA